MTTYCPHCGRPDTEPYQVISRHRTMAGMTVWSRCECGSLQVRLLDGTGGHVVSRTRPAAHV